MYDTLRVPGFGAVAAGNVVRGPNMFACLVGGSLRGRILVRGQEKLTLGGLGMLGLSRMGGRLRGGGAGRIGEDGVAG